MVTRYVAARTLRHGDREYVPGEYVDLSEIPFIEILINTGAVWRIIDGDLSKMPPHVYQAMSKRHPSAVDGKRRGRPRKA